MEEKKTSGRYPWGKSHMLTNEGTKENTLYLVYRSYDSDIDGYPVYDDMLLYATRDSGKALRFANEEWDSLVEYYSDKGQIPNEWDRPLAIDGDHVSYEIAWQLCMNKGFVGYYEYITVVKVILDPPTDDVKE